MSMMMRVRVFRGGRKVLRWCRRPTIKSPDPWQIVPTEPIKSAVSAKVRQVETAVRDGLRQMKAGGELRRLRRRAQEQLRRALWWWERIRWRLIFRQWVVGMVVDEVHRCQAWWRDLRLRMVLRLVDVLRRKTGQAAGQDAS